MTHLHTPITPDLLRGALDLEATDLGLRPHRLPPRARALADAQLLMAESHTSGVRLAFTTTASVIELEGIPTRRAYVGAPPPPDGVHDLAVDGVVVDRQTAPGGRLVTIDLTTGGTDVTDGGPVRLRFDGLGSAEKDVEVWLPWDEATELVALHTDAPVAPAAADTRPRWLHHGSSISQGSVSARPTETWVASAARTADLDLLNLGFAGSALLDPFVARTIRDTPADLISLKLGINVVNHDAMTRRAFVPAVEGFLDLVRDGHPDTPLLVVSPILCPVHEDTPGPAYPDFSAEDGQVRFRATGDPAAVAAGRLTLTVIREVLADVVARRRREGDTAISYLDGRELYGDADVEAHPLPDALHPDAALQRLIGDRFARLALAEPGFAAVSSTPTA